jgi:hypothetical protein
MIYIGITNVLFLLRSILAQNAILRNQMYFIIIFFLFVFSAFRYQVGCDWFGYYNQWLNASPDKIETLTFFNEPIWNVALVFIRYMDWPYPTVNVLSSLIFFLGIHAFARKQPDRLAFLILLFPILIINMPMSGIRQGAAIGMMCVAFTAFIERRPFRFMFWLIVATGFHVSALIFLLLLPLSAGRFSKTRIILSAILALPGLFILAFTVAFERAISMYVGTEIDAAGGIFRVGMQVLTVLYFLIFLRKKWLQVSPQDYSLVFIYMVAIAAVGLIVTISSTMGDRINYYFIPIQAMIFARIPFLPFKRSRMLHTALPYLGLFIIFATWTILSDHFTKCYIPYQSWIFGFPGRDSNGI